MKLVHQGEVCILSFMRRSRNGLTAPKRFYRDGGVEKLTSGRSEVQGKILGVGLVEKVPTGYGVFIAKCWYNNKYINYL